MNKDIRADSQKLLPIYGVYLVHFVPKTHNNQHTKGDTSREQTDFVGMACINCFVSMTLSSGDDA